MSESMDAHVTALASSLSHTESFVPHGKLKAEWQQWSPRNT